MLSFEELKSELAKYTYRPGWKFTLWDREREGILLYIIAEVENSYDTSAPVVLRINTWVPPMQTYKQFTGWLFWRLKMIEIHECMEWFKRDGHVVYDPHADVDPTDQELREYVQNR